MESIDEIQLKLQMLLQSVSNTSSEQMGPPPTYMDGLSHLYSNYSIIEEQFCVFLPIIFMYVS